jgi:hypothetical protein
MHGPMKQNRPLLIFLGAMVAVLSGILLPDFFACHQFHLFKSPEEQRIEALESLDTRPRLGQGVKSIAIDFNAATIVVDEANPQFSDSLLIHVEQVVEASYRHRHRGDSSADSCFRITLLNTGGHTIGICESHDSVTRLVENAGLCGITY